MSEQTPLLEAYLNGELDAQGFVAFNNWLREDPEHLRRWAVASFMVQELGEALTEQREAAAQSPVSDKASAAKQGVMDAEVLELLKQIEASSHDAPLRNLTEERAAQKKAAKQRQTDDIDFATAVRELSWFAGKVARHAIVSKPAILTGIAAIVLLALILINPFASDAPDTVADLDFWDDVETPLSSAVATLTASHNAQWGTTPAERALARGSSLRPGQRLTLTTGTAEITTGRGAVAIIQAPTTVELLDNDNAIRLHAGKLVGICETDSSKGFLVRTPHMDVIDLGTRFGVDVMPYRWTEVHVHQGEVLVAPTNASASASTRKQIITTNQAVRNESTRAAITAIAPSFEKFHQALNVYRLPGTGFGLAEGAVDPNWQIIADANGPLDQPLHVIVQHSKSKQYPHFDVRGNDPDIAQWLFFGGDKSAYYPYETPGHVKPTRLLYEGRVDLPEQIDLRDKTLYLRYGCHQGLNALSINGQAIEPLPKNRYQAGKSLFREIEMPIDQTALRPGENILHVDLINHTTPQLASFYLAWELRPATTSEPNTGETAP